VSHRPLLLDVAIAVVIVTVVLLVAHGVAAVAVLAVAVLFALGITAVVGRIHRRRPNPSGRPRGSRRRVT